MYKPWKTIISKLSRTKCYSPRETDDWRLSGVKGQKHLKCLRVSRRQEKFSEGNTNSLPLPNFFVN